MPATRNTMERATAKRYHAATKRKI